MSAPSIARLPLAPMPAQPPPQVPPLRVLPATPEERRTWDRVRFEGPRTPAAREEDEGRGPHLVWSDRGLPELPDAATWCGTLVRAAVEALVGARPTAQLSRWLSTELWTALNRRAVLGVQIAGRPQRPHPVTVRRVHACEISPTTCEASVVVHDGERVRAAAIRIEVHRGRWRATALQIG